MTTSGTVGTTQLDIAKLIEKTYRRCGIPTGGITPELIDIARENFFLLFNNFSNHGVNLWCVDKPLIGLKNSKSTYDMPAGTIDILNAKYRQCTIVTPTSTTVGATTIVQDLGSSTDGYMYSITTDADMIATVSLAGSDDNITYTTMDTVASQSYTAGENYWYEFDPVGSYRYWKLTVTTAGSVNDVTFSMTSAYTDLIITRMNRDDYESMPNKRYEGSTSLQYMFDRQIAPKMVLWPVPNIETNCISLVTHRQIQDVGNSLTATIEVPDRWLDAFSWSHAAMCAVECPQVAQDRIALTQQQAAISVMAAEGEERDNSPIFLAPNISVYTR